MPRPGTAWEVHHAFNSWSEDPNIWISTGAIEHYCGVSKTLEELVARGQWLQAEGYKSVFEEASPPGAALRNGIELVLQRTAALGGQQ